MYAAMHSYAESCLALSFWEVPEAAAAYPQSPRRIISAKSSAMAPQSYSMLLWYQKIVSLFSWIDIVLCFFVSPIYSSIASRSLDNQNHTYHKNAMIHLTTSK